MMLIPYRRPSVAILIPSPGHARRSPLLVRRSLSLPLQGKVAGALRQTDEVVSHPIPSPGHARRSPLLVRRSPPGPCPPISKAFPSRGRWLALCARRMRSSPPSPRSHRHSHPRAMPADPIPSTSHPGRVRRSPSPSLWGMSPALYCTCKTIHRPRRDPLAPRSVRPPRWLLIPAPDRPAADHLIASLLIT